MKLDMIKLITIGIVIAIAIISIVVCVNSYKKAEIAEKIILDTATTTISSDGKETESESVRGEYAVEDGAIMVVTNTNGNITISTIDKDSIKNYAQNRTSASTKYTEDGSKVTSTEPYIPDGMKVADPNENKPVDMPVVHRKIDPDKVTIEVLKDTISNTYAEILITDNNETPCGWGEPFRIQELKDGKWVESETIGEMIFKSIGYLLNEDNQLKQKVNWEYIYGELDAGTYRIVKPVYSGEEYIDLYSNEFEIK